ncbi:unnamed protein product [Arabidopsis arenosa]|uniref:Ubiquitin-like protease family profile domain-containing protein n=1 Tax=Arabidopsis arenosa TaxID=38785 RepID=A0A8S1ZHC0_ARAAE|nr:unnamed protein product [Arabidopsis arenosa]
MGDGVDLNNPTVQKASLQGDVSDINPNHEVDLPVNTSVISNDGTNLESGVSKNSISSPGEEAKSESHEAGQMGSEPILADVPSQSNVVGNPGERRSKRLRTISSKLDGRFQFDNKDVRKKPLSNKVIDALLKFSRHILRTDDVDEELLNTNFISHLCRLFPKFSKAPVPEDFQFPKALIDAVSGVGELDRAQLYNI